MVNVVVVGGGNAGYCAAIAAAQAGATVRLLEKAPYEWRGGNSYFTQGGFRVAMEDGLASAIPLLHEPDRELLSNTELAPYTWQQYADDIRRVTDGRGDPELGGMIAERSYRTVTWLRDLGQRFELAYDRKAFHRDGRWQFWDGAGVRTIRLGIGMMEGYEGIATDHGVTVQYSTPVVDLLRNADGSVAGVVVAGSDGPREFVADAVVLASGGFGANPMMRSAYLGAGWDLASVRGTPFDTGDGLEMAMRHGALPRGHWSGCHAVAWEAEARPDQGDRVVTNRLTRSSYQLGIVVNRHGQRFFDEGADFRTQTYAKYGGEILRQPGGFVFQIFDTKVRKLLNLEYDFNVDGKGGLHAANSVAELAERLGLDSAALVKTVDGYNRATRDGTFEPAKKDGLSTTCITPPKSNWALPLSDPPFYGCKVVCGITFTYGGLHVDAQARVHDRGRRPIPGLFAAGELVGGIFYHNYPGGTGLMSGAVFGREAGINAAAA